MAVEDSSLDFEDFNLELKNRRTSLLPCIFRDTLMHKFDFYSNDFNSVDLDEFIEVHNRTSVLYTDVTKEEVSDVINGNGLYFSDLEVKDNKISYKNIECKLTFYTSGTIIVENDLRNYFPEVKGNLSMGASGIVNLMEKYGKLNFLHGYVGNSCPSLAYSKEQENVIIGLDWDEDTDTEILPDETYDIVASVCTDLWWYSICDAEEFMMRNPDEDLSDLTTINITPGTWELTHYYGVCRNSNGSPLAELKLIKKYTK